jgi:hypothetical protein
MSSSMSETQAAAYVVCVTVVPVTRHHYLPHLA